MSTLALCIPAYNAAQYLPNLLLSANNQIIPFNEILVYNDCSTDDTAEVARRLGAKVINGDINKGCSWGKNELAASTSCKWIHFHDADDVLLPNFTTLAHKWMAYANCPDIVLFDYEYRDYNSNEILSIRKFDEASLKNNAVEYAINNQINPFCGLYNKQRFLDAGGYNTNPQVLYFEDAAFHIKMAMAGLTFGVEKEISIINYRITSSMSATNMDKCLAAQYYVYDDIAKQTGKKYARLIASKMWHLAGRFAVVNNWGYVKSAINISNELGYRYAVEQNRGFTFLSYVNPYFAVWVREKAIRIFRPQLRNND